MSRFVGVVATLMAFAVFVTPSEVLASTTIDISATARTILNGAGPTAWNARNDDAGCDVVGYSPLADANYSGNSDSFNGGFVTSVNGTTAGFMDVGGIGTRSKGNFKVGPEPTGGLIVSRTERAIKGSPTLRDLITLKNPASHKVAVTAWIDSDLGSDNATVTQATSSGDATLGASDRWVISTDAAAAPFDDPPVTEVLYGVGASVKTSTVLADPGGAVGTRGCMQVQMKLRVPAKSTRYLLLFAQVHTYTDLAPATADVGMFNPRRLSPGLLASIPSRDYAKILNWDLG